MMCYIKHRGSVTGIVFGVNCKGILGHFFMKKSAERNTEIILTRCVIFVKGAWILQHRLSVSCDFVGQQNEAFIYSKRL